MAEIKSWLSPGMPFVRIILGGRDINAIPNYLEKFSHEVFSDGAMGKTTITLFDNEWDTLENLIIPDDRAIQYEFGWANGRMSKMQEGVVLKYQPTFEHTGLRLHLELTGNLLRDAQQVYSRSWKSKKVSEIIADIFNTSQWNLDVEETSGRITIEQQNVTNAFFIENVLKPKAKSARTGQAGYEFRCEGSTIVFRTPDYEQGIIRRYIYGRTANSEVLSFSPQFNGYMMLASGGGDIRVEGYDVMTKQPVVQNININNSGPRIAQGDRTITTEDQGGSTGRMYTLPYDDPKQVEAWANWKLAKARTLTWRASMQIMGDPTLVVGDLIEVMIQKSDGDVHYTSGVYRIYRVNHSITRGSYVTNLELGTDGSRHPDQGKNAGTKRQQQLIDRGEDDRDEGAEISSE